MCALNRHKYQYPALYLKEHRKGLYLELVLSGKLNEHLHQADGQTGGADEGKAGSDRGTEAAESNDMGWENE